MSTNPKYLKGLTKNQAEQKKENIKETKKLIEEGKKSEAFKLAEKRPIVKGGKESSYTQRFKKQFPDVKPLTADFTKSTGIPLKVQREVFKRGKGAYATSGSRATVKSPEQWAYARLYAFYYKSIAGNLNFDKDLAENVKFKATSPKRKTKATSPKRKTKGKK